MSLADLARRLENLIRIGTIAEVDVADITGPRVRVKDGELLTGWLPFGAMRAGTARVWSVPTVGEQVLVLSPSGDMASAVVFGSLYSATTPAPSTDPHEHIIDFADGTRFSHNDATGAMVFTGMKTLLLKANQSITLDTAKVMVKASDSVTVDTPQTTVTGKTTIKGLLSYLAGLAGSGGTGGPGAQITGEVKITGDVRTTGTLYNNDKDIGSNHTHGGVAPGAAKTGVPS